jgi:hypothetical protein
MGKVLEGKIEYRDGFPPALKQSEADSGYVLFCSALPRSDLVIEIRSREESGFN